ncbi:MAG: ABC transporter ATP-binding protein, partial [Solirubrobacteraceae bacterium]
LLVLDEPVADLDPLARREFLQVLMEHAAENEVSVVLSSHLVADLERVCDYLILVVDGRVRLSGEIEQLLVTHRRLSGPRRDTARLPASLQVIEEAHTERQSTLLVRTRQPIIDPSWSAEQVGLEDIALAYMRGGWSMTDADPVRNA